jgi:hypothetical protein
MSMPTRVAEFRVPRWRAECSSCRRWRQHGLAVDSRGRLRGRRGQRQGAGTPGDTQTASDSIGLIFLSGGGAGARPPEASFK